MLLIIAVLLATPAAMIIHELGHLFAARRCKVSASELCLGMGPKILSFCLGSVRFSLGAIPVASYVMLDSTTLKKKSVRQQLFVHLGGIIFNLIAGLATYGTVFSWINLLLAAGNLLPLYQHDGWKCGVVLMRSFLPRRSQPVEWAFTFSGGFVSVAIVAAMIRVFS